MDAVVGPSADLSATIVASIEGWVPVFGCLPGGHVERVHGVTRWTSDVPLPMFNGIIGWPSGGDVDVLLDDIARPFVADGIPALWVTPPGADAEAGLRARGFHVGTTPGMAMDLRELPPLEVPDGVQVRSVDEDPALLDEALRISMVTNDFPADAVGPLRAAIDAYPERARLRTFLASVNGVPAAASALWCCAGVAGLYNVGTLVGFRGRGLGRLVSLAAMLAGRDAGYRVGVLQASELGYPVYEKIGFTTHGEFSFAVRMPGQEET
jgi:hypothetical protein